MKNKIKYVVILFMLSIIGIMSINLFQPRKEQQAQGRIELFVNEDSYDYLVECANNFMKLNDKTLITIKKLQNYNEITNAIKETPKIEQPNIAQIDRFNFDKLKLNGCEYYNKGDKLLNNYANNFSKYRINQVKYGDNLIGIPLTSRPLALYLREDMLKKYGYERDNLNTWDDVITVGKDIYIKSQGTVNILNATGQDYEDLVDLITMECFSDEKTINDVKLEVQAMLKNLTDNNILNVKNEGEFLGRISSINAMREIMQIQEVCTWSAGNAPSIKPGTNKFFASEGDNLLVINQTTENEKLIEKFITYVVTNNKDTIQYVKEGKFFSSYLYTYGSKEIEGDVKNFIGKSPLVVLSNIEEKTPEIKDYAKYIKIKQELRAQ